MIEKAKIKEGLIFWLETDGTLLTPDSKLIAVKGNCLMEIEAIKGVNVICTIYNEDICTFGLPTILPIGYIADGGDEIELDDNDRQELISIYNSICSNKNPLGDWKRYVSKEQAIRIWNLFSRDFYQKYNLKKGC